MLNRLDEQYTKATSSKQLAVPAPAAKPKGKLEAKADADGGKTPAQKDDERKRRLTGGGLATKRRIGQVNPVFRGFRGNTNIAHFAAKAHVSTLIENDGTFRPKLSRIPQTSSIVGDMAPASPGFNCQLGVWQSDLGIMRPRTQAEGS